MPLKGVWIYRLTYIDVIASQCLCCLCSMHLCDPIVESRSIHRCFVQTTNLSNQVPNHRSMNDPSLDWKVDSAFSRIRIVAVLFLLLYVTVVAYRLM